MDDELDLCPHCHNSLVRMGRSTDMRHYKLMPYRQVTLYYQCLSCLDGTSWTWIE